MTDDIFSKPPAHGYVVNWLGPPMVGKLLEFSQSQQAGFRESEVWNGIKREGEINSTHRRSWHINLSDELRDEITARARALLPDMCGQLGNKPFEPREIEVGLVAHGDGAFFREHQDRFGDSRSADRLISAIYYFHRIPKSFSGGALRIYPIAGSKESTAFVEIEPINDTLVFFPSWFPHEVLPVNCPSGRFEDSRFAINCWFNR